MASPRGKKRTLSEDQQEDLPEEEAVGEEEGSSEDGEESGDEPFASVPASDIFSPAKEETRRTLLPARVSYTDRPFIIDGTLGDSAVLCVLPHARAGKAQYVVQQGTIFEIHRVRREPGSWFAGDAVIEDSSLFLATPIDPLFLIIPLLEKSRKKDDQREGYFNPLAQAVAEDDEFRAGMQRALALGVFNTAHIICDLKELGDEKLYRLNDAKLLAWLELKIIGMISRFKNMDPVICRTAAVAANVNLANQDLSDDDATKLAISLLSEYISADWIRRVCGTFGVPEPTAAKPPSAYLTIEPKTYRRASEKETTTKPKAPVAIRRLENVDKRGMSSITSFFKPKAKPASK